MALLVPVVAQSLWYPFWGIRLHLSPGPPRGGRAWVMDTPFKWTKEVPSHFGGTAQGVAMSWPGTSTMLGGVRRQFHHVIDIVPTILEAAGIPGAQDGERRRAAPMDGVSMAYTCNKGSVECPMNRITQYFEMLGPCHLSGRLGRGHAGGDDTVETQQSPAAPHCRASPATSGSPMGR